MTVRRLTIIALISLLPICIYYVGATSAAGTVLSDLAASMQPGTWAELTTSNINPTLSFSGGASDHITPYADTMVWDPTTRRAFFIGGDHAPADGCPRFVSYTESTNTWQILPRPSWFPCMPTIMHGYNHSAIDTVRGKLYHRPYSSMVVRKYDIASDTWTSLPAIPSSVMGYNQCCTAIAWFPERNSLVYASIESGANGAFAEYRESTGQWVRIGGNLPMGGYHNIAKYNPVHKVVIFGGGQSDRHLYKFDSAGQLTMLANAATGVGVMESVMTVDPVTGKHLVIDNSKRLYLYDVPTDTWTLQPGTPPVFNGQLDNPVVTGILATPVSDYGVTMFSKCFSKDCRVYLYKAAGGAAPSFDFSMSSEGAKTVSAGQAVTNAITLTATSGTPQSVSLSASGLPAGTTASFNSTSCTPNCSSTVTLSTSSSTPAGSFTITVTGTSGSLSRTTSFALATETATPQPPSDFTTRCAAAGVVKCVGFDQASDIAGTYGDNSGIMPGTATPQLDAAVRASGNSALKFTIPSNSGANSSGSYFTNFSNNLSVQFAANADFYVQWRQRFSPEFISTAYQGGGGWKQSIIGTGDKPGCSSSNTSGGQCYSSCSTLETVTQNTVHRGFAQMYNSCSGSASHGPYHPFEQPFGSSDFKMQNARPSPYCLYSQGQANPPTYFPPSGNCFGYFPDEWMTFQVRIKTGPRVGDEFSNSFVELWIAREGQPSQQVINWGPYNLSAGSAAENQQFGKIWLLPYNTGKSSGQSHPTAYTWYDELIISTTRIADPGAGTPGDTTPPSISSVASSGITTSGATVTWTTNEASDTQVEYGTTIAYGNQTPLNTSLVTSHSQGLTGLAAGTMYNYRVKSRDAAGNIATSGNFTFTTAPASDSIAPVISSVAASTLTPSGATITWTTNEASDTQVEYGITTAYGNQTTLNPSLLTSHSQGLTGLSAGTVYNYRVKSRDAAGNLAVSANSTFTTVESLPPGAGLIGYWAFNEAIGASAADSSGSNYHGTLVNGPIWTPGQVGNALRFNATDNQNDNDDPRVVVGTTFDVPALPLTIAAWVNPVDFNDWRAIISKRDAAILGETRFSTGLSSGNGRVYINTSNGDRVEFSYGVATNVWTHITVVATAADTKLYVNGVLQQTVARGVILGNDATANTVIGGTGEPAGGDNDPFKGLIDEVRVYAAALTDSEIQQIAAATLDTSAPSIAISAPAPGATVSGNTQVEATASDNIGVAGVRFRLDGINLGAEDTTFPYAITWDTTAAAGSHVLTALARDAAGNQSVSAALTVTVSNAAPTVPVPPPGGGGGGSLPPPPTTPPQVPTEPSTTTYSIPPNGGNSWTMAGTSNLLQVGSARILPDVSNTVLAGVAIFGFRSNGVLVTEAGVPVSPAIQSGRVLVDMSGPVNTGIAMANPGLEDAWISFYLTDDDGRDLGYAGNFLLPARQQFARFLSEHPFNVRPGFRGVFHFGASARVSVVALRGYTNERSEFLITTLPIMPQTGGSTAPLVFPHFADGGGWQTQVVLTNPTPAEIRGTLQFMGQGVPGSSASPVMVSVYGGMNSSFDYLIPPGGVVRMSTANTGNTTQVGSVRAIPAGTMAAPSGLVVFSFKHSGTTISEASVPSASPGSAFRLYAESLGEWGAPGATQTGIAISNPSSSAAVVNVEAINLDGTSAGVSVSVSVPGDGQIAKFIRELLPTLSAPFRGILRLTAASPIHVTGLRGTYNERGDFLITTTAPSDEGTGTPTSELMFPHLVSGEGYTTQLILINGSATSRAAGNLYIRSREGVLQTSATLQGVQ